MLVFSDATFRVLPTSMETESSNGKEGVVMSTYLIILIHLFIYLLLLVTGIGLRVY